MVTDVDGVEDVDTPYELVDAGTVCVLSIATFCEAEDGVGLCDVEVFCAFSRIEATEVVSIAELDDGEGTIMGVDVWRSAEVTTEDVL